MGAQLPHNYHFHLFHILKTNTTYYSNVLVNMYFRKSMKSAVATIILGTLCFPEVSHARHLLGEGPNVKPTVIDALGCDATFSTLKAAVTEAGLVDTLKNPDAEFTVFAPTNAAFSEALDALELTTEELLARDDLADILKYHVIDGKTLSDDLPEGETIVSTILGPDKELKIVKEGNDITVNGASVTWADIISENGVVHVIDQVLLPPANEETKTVEEDLDDADETNAIDEAPVLG